jgi:hypothetical protein
MQFPLHCLFSGNFPQEDLFSCQALYGTRSLIRTGDVKISSLFYATKHEMAPLVVKNPSLAEIIFSCRINSRYLYQVFFIG